METTQTADFVWIFETLMQQQSQTNMA